MIISKLRQRVELLRFNWIKDSFGAVVGDWVTVKKVWADIQIKTGKEIIEDKQVKSEVSTDITIRYIPYITSKDRIKHNDNVYEILSVINVDMRYKELKLVCKEVI